jgi:two-component system, chemotaxis family, protein-glutamate methylesterase/glutaminase
VPTNAPGPESELMATEVSMIAQPTGADRAEHPGEPSAFVCPDCSGPLYEITEGKLARYRCRVGHAWSPQALAEEQSQALEGALWMALRGLEEKAALSRHMGERAAERGHPHSAARFRGRSEEAMEAASLLRKLLHRGELSGEGLPDEAGEV